MLNTAESYDRVPYPTHARPITHPERMAVIARLAGLRPAAVDRCRVLELGASDGMNCIAMAVGLPASEFVAIDIAPGAVARGQAVVQSLGLRNVRVEVGDIAELDPGLGEFDYVIAHGVYSWVPPAIRDDLLAAARTHLAPQGVALISYNALPGGFGLQALREMMLFHIRAVSEPEQRLHEAKALLGLIASVPPVGHPSEVRNFMRSLVERTARRNLAHVFHDHIAEFNDAFYLTQFTQHADTHGLRVLGDAEYFGSSTVTFPAQVQDVLAAIEREGGRVLRDQYIDFITARQFHTSLLCRRELTLAHERVAEAITGLHVSGNTVPQSPQPDGSQTFTVPGRGAITTANPVAKAAYVLLHRIYPRAIPFAQLLDVALAEARESSPRAAAERDLSFMLERAYGAGQIELHTRPPLVVDAPGERPLASPLARLEAAAGQREVTTLRHDRFAIVEDVGRHFIQLLDGTRDREALIDALLPMCRPDIPRAELGAEIDRKLVELGRIGLLLG